MTQEINYTFDFSYDHDWRLTGTTFTMNGISKRLNTLEYNELSQLKAKYFNGTATAYLQRQLYHYNARGWLTSINNPYECPNDVFAMKLYYDNVPTYASSLATGCYNGNIAMIEWFTQIQNTYVNGYGFKYDGLNRLKAGRFFSRFDASAVVEPMPTYYADGIVSGIGSEKEITYDKNGNILTLNRYGHHSGGTVLFDQLSYQYDGNRLMRVIDANPNSFLSGEFCNTAAPNLQNSYDANGNLTFDVDRNMLLFYNDDNLPTNISFSNWAMTNGYRADGVKMSKSIYNAEGRTVLQEEYFGNLVLNFGKPVRILHADGVIELNASLQPTFYYYLKDHLGNIRAVVSPTATNSVHIDQTSEYYPFGMNISKNFTSTTINKYKYNGKEEQEMPGRWLDYGARFYDPQIGRFTIVDPLAERRIGWSPYAYCLNNPILRIDPNGLTDFTFDKKTGDVKQVGEKNDDPDRILKTNRKGEIKYNRKGEAKVAVGGIEQGILKDGQNFKNKDQVISVGGEGQPSVEGVKSFTLKLSEYVGKEMKGFSYSSNGSGNATDMVLGKYKNNTYTSYYGSPQELIKKYGANFSFNNILQEFHTHPNGELGATQSAPEQSQDVNALQSDKPLIPNASFIILYRTTGQEQPAEYDYTHEYRP